MSERAFLLPEAKRRATETIRAIEAQTGAEVVVTVRHSASRYFGASALFGGVVAAVVLVVMLVSPQVYDVRTMPLDTLLAFVLATLACHFVPSLKRLLTPAARRRLAAEAAARTAFAELGVARTKEHTGLLVFVALFERTTVVTTDTGVPVTFLGAPYEEIVKELDRSTKRLDFEGFLTALARLGPLLASVLPRRPDDVNELSDEVA